MMSSHDGAPAGGLWSRSMMAVMAVMVAQFFSAFGDNALLFATLALMKTLHYPDWSQPILQMLFVGAYIVLAPFVGHFADGFPKGRVMMVANGVKLVGTLLVCFGGDPFLGYCLVGVGAAAYSPAKYGILGELTTGDQLVRANGLMEGSTIAAILIGSVAGGVLADWHVAGALAICALTYGLAMLANLFIPRLTAARTRPHHRPLEMMRAFYDHCRLLGRDGQTRFAIIGTSLFWGAGVTLRFLLVLWVPVALGIVFGAAAAARLWTAGRYRYAGRFLHRTAQRPVAAPWTAERRCRQHYRRAEFRRKYCHAADAGAVYAGGVITGSGGGDRGRLRSAVRAGDRRALVV